MLLFTYLLYCTVFRFRTLVHFRRCRFSNIGEVAGHMYTSCIVSGCSGMDFSGCQRSIIIMVEHAVDRSLSGEQTWCRYVDSVPNSQW